VFVRWRAHGVQNGARKRWLERCKSKIGEVGGRNLDRPAEMARADGGSRAAMTLALHRR
jgi:hypothetical protein